MSMYLAFEQGVAERIHKKVIKVVARRGKGERGWDRVAGNPRLNPFN